ncbi:MAG: hypothetical protein Kow0077_21850 [Anaerolineae bacterium]
MAPEGTKTIDSLSANEFQVEINGTVVEGIFSVRGLTSFMLDGDLPPLVISKMVQRDPNNPFNVWTRETLKGKRAARDVAIVAMDEGEETRRWVYRKAHITAINFSDFDSGRSELVEEQITIKAAKVEEIWPK